jgi:mono/diheme cytochrome c family protein
MVLAPGSSDGGARPGGRHVCSPPMVAALAFVLAFVLLGLGVVFVAFRGGPRRAVRPGSVASRRGRQVTLAGVSVVVLALGVAVPLAIALANRGSHAKNAPGGVRLTTAEVAGRQLFARYCSTCHTLGAANAVGKVGPNLDTLRPPKVLVLDAIAKGRARGQGQMPAGLVDGEDAQHVADFVVAVAGRK